MATSGTISTTVFTTRKVVDEALRSCGVNAGKITVEMQQIALDNLYLLMSAWAAKGAPLWAQQKSLVALQEGLGSYSMSNGTIDVLDVNVRSTNRLTGTYASSAGGTAASAFDDDYATSCTQGAPAGNVSMVMAEDNVVSVVGVMTNGALTGSLIFEYSTDGGATWSTAYAPGSLTYADKVWSWFDLDPYFTCDAFRVRADTGVTLNLREFYIGNNPSSIPMGRMNRDDYMSFPNKQFPGRPLQYWCDRQLNVPVLRVWPVTDAGSRDQQIEVMAKRHLMDVGTLRQTLEIPQRWYDSLIWMLAWRLCAKLPDDVDPARVTLIKPFAMEAEAMMQNEESDDSPIRWAPNLMPYTA